MAVESNAPTCSCSHPGVFGHEADCPAYPWRRESGVATWDRLHQNKRHNLAYPSEHVVRFLDAVPWQDRTLAVDIGCGTGRHLKLLRDYGCAAYGCDFSRDAIIRARLAAGHDVYTHLDVAPASALPYKDDYFRIAIAYGVFYYGTPADAAAAISELHRVMQPGGHGFVCVRTNRDWRANRDLAGEPEAGMRMHFLDETDVWRMYDLFDEVRLERSEWTTHNQVRRNSDWLITVRK